jgi:hypothetical protein
VAEIRRQPWQALLDIDSGAMPIAYGPDCEGMPQVVETWSAVSIADSSQPDQTQEHVVEVLMDDPCARA